MCENCLHFRVILLWVTNKGNWSRKEKSVECCCFWIRKLQCSISLLSSSPLLSSTSSPLHQFIVYRQQSLFRLESYTECSHFIQCVPRLLVTCWFTRVLSVGHSIEAVYPVLPVLIQLLLYWLYFHIFILSSFYFLRFLFN